MKHLIICREYPPAPGGGIGTYVQYISRLLAESGETVHVIGQLWEGAERAVEEHYHGKLIIYRVPFEDWTTFFRAKPSPLIGSKTARDLFASEFPPQCFSWQASLLAERLVETEGVDVVEAQDYEAPLYYFQLRRALGLGPKKTPPCIIHLHSPTEFIGRYNEWTMALPCWTTAKRMEDYSIAAADAWLCPSRFFASQAQSRYGLPDSDIEVVPYPVGDTCLIERSCETWSTGNVCYVGRLEKRKGVHEWIEAAVTVAQQYPNARFEFVGANVLGPNLIFSEELLNRLVPRRLRARFLFHAEVNRSAIPQFLKRARIAVVPSRWENFPYTCVEAMASGLPMIVSPEGGMAEMITDGQTGWIAENGQKEGLQKALRRALQTPPMRIAEMGKQAAKSIWQICDNQQVVKRHLSFRSRLVSRGAKRSLVPLEPPLSERPAAGHKMSVEITIPEVLVDYTSTDFASAAKNSTQQVSLDILETFTGLVARNTERIGGLTAYSPAISGNGSNGRLHEPLAIIRCLIGNPRITFRVLQQVAARLARRAQIGL